MLSVLKKAHVQASDELDKVLEGMKKKLPVGELEELEQSDLGGLAGSCCGLCGLSPITEVLYRCTECVAFDLCQDCEASGKHPSSHPLLKMRGPMLGNITSSSPVVSEDDTEPDSPSEPDRSPAGKSQVTECSLVVSKGFTSHFFLRG